MSKVSCIIPVPRYLNVEVEESIMCGSGSGSGTGAGDGDGIYGTSCQDGWYLTGSAN